MGPAGHGRTMDQLPNVLTLTRLALAPAIAWLLVTQQDKAALALFIAAAVSDLIDGMLARRWGRQTRFGAMADPLADKAVGLLVVVVLTWQASLQPWFAAAVVARDALIVGGALAYRLMIGRIEIAPTGISKLNTALLFVLLAGVLGLRAGLVPDGVWLNTLQWATLATTIGSGGHYLVAWSRKAVHARRAGRGTA